MIHESAVLDEATVPETADNFSLAQIAGNYVLAPKTSLTWESCEELDAILNNLSHGRQEGVILDFKSVLWMDSQVLELLCRWHEALKKRGCSLKLTGLNEFCRRMLGATRLLGVFCIYGDCMEAVRN